MTSFETIGFEITSFEITRHKRIRLKIFKKQ
jgi:hypothetical protein